MTPPAADQQAIASTLDELRSAGQGRIADHAESLDGDARAGLIAQAARLDLPRLRQLVDTYVTAKPEPHLPGNMAPPAHFYPRDPGAGRRDWDKAAARDAGETLVSAGKVAAFVVAGGQGTRLGAKGPKGKYPAGPVTGKPLFQVFAEQIRATADRYGAAIPFYVMTSPINHDETTGFFREHDHFGLNPNDVMFFSQGTMPSFDMRTGELLLADATTLATNPDGHGGSLKALHTSGALDDMQRRGVEHISYFQVDNPAVACIDPVFLGLHANAQDSSAEMSSKVLAKRDPYEKLGVIGTVDGKAQVIEYSDLPDHLAEQRNPDGSLTYSAGSIAIHCLSVDFVRRLNTMPGGFALPLHRAEKKVPHYDPSSGRVVEPSEPNAVKLETFVFDALPMCDKSIVLETDRIEEFAPIKNAEGNDSPATSAQILTERAARWLERVGISVPRNAAGEPDCTLEIAPLTALDASQLQGAGGLPRSIEPGSTLAI